MTVAAVQESGAGFRKTPVEPLSETTNDQPLPGPSKLEDELSHLDGLDIQTLQDTWRRTFGRRPPAKLKSEFLRRALAYQTQEQHSGGLSRQALIRLKAWSKGTRGDEEFFASPKASPLTKPGTRFVREWQNEMHEVLTIETGGFVYKAKTYRSLTEIARAITGTHQSGPRFFGLCKLEKQHG